MTRPTGALRRMAASLRGRHIASGSRARSEGSLRVPREGMPEVRGDVEATRHISEPTVIPTR